jgi:hypothetical protein
MSFLDHSPAEEWDALSKKRRAQARRVNEAIKDEQRVANSTKHKKHETWDKEKGEYVEVSWPGINEMFDTVNKPEHYNIGIVECIDYIQDRLSDEEFLGYLNGNLIKYLHRWKDKNGIEDLCKARWYLDKLIEEKCNV